MMPDPSITAPLETYEFLAANTSVRALKDIDDQPRGNGVDTRPERQGEYLRHTLRLHRFSVMSWLMQNGVKIPAELLCDGAHPEPGLQYPDGRV